MTQLPTTPSEMADMVEELYDTLVERGILIHPDIFTAALAELGLNQRTLFIDEARYGPRQPADDPMKRGETSSHLSPPPAEAPKAAESPLAAPAAPKPPVLPSDKAWTRYDGCAVADLLPYLSDRGGMPEKMFAIYANMGKGRYPVSREARVHALEALTPLERGTLLAAVRP